MSTSAESLQVRKQELVKGAIWDAAMDLFSERGFENATIEEIAAAAGVSRRTFFRYFASKNDLMAQGIVTYGTVLEEAIRSCPASWPPLRVVHEVVLTVAKGAAEHPRTRQIMQVAAESAAAREAQLSRLAEAEDRVAGAFAARSQARSTVEKVTPRLLGGMTFLVLDVTFREWFEDRHADICSTAEQVFCAFADLAYAVNGKTFRRSRPQQTPSTSSPRRDRLR